MDTELEKRLKGVEVSMRVMMERQMKMEAYLMAMIGYVTKSPGNRDIALVENAADGVLIEIQKENQLRFQDVLKHWQEICQETEPQESSP